MLTIRFKPSEDQDRDDSILFDLTCEDVPVGMEQDIEFEFSGTNLSFDASKIALKDIFDPATKGARSHVRALLQGPGQAVAIMATSYKGNPMGSARHTFDIT